MALLMAQASATRKMSEAIAFALSSRRTLAVTLLSFSSGLPLGIVWYAIPDWMRSSGVDIRIVGLTTLAHAPWTFKMLWSPLMDRFVPPFLGRRRGWIAITQVALFALTLGLAGQAANPETPWVILALAFAIAFASASQDIVVDAYAVDVLRPEEQGIAVGARFGAYRVAMAIAGALSITLAGSLGWPTVDVLLALLYLVMVFVTVRAPEPDVRVVPPQTLRKAVWEPFLGFVSRHRALELLAFVVLYKLADNLSQSLLRPFLVDMGYTEYDRGIALGTVGVISTIVGTFLGGALTTTMGLGRSLWVFGFLQIFSNLGYILVAQTGVNRPLMYGAMGFEMITTGMGMGAFGVLLLRLTEKRFSATQYALFSSLFALPRLAAGPITGFTVHALGWTNFFWITMVAGIPGLVMLSRFVPFGAREPQFEIDEPSRQQTPLATRTVAWRGLLGGAIGTLATLVTIAAILGLDHLRADPPQEFDLLRELGAFFPPTSVNGYLLLLGALLLGTVTALLTAAVSAARHGGIPDSRAG